ncbi:MAG: T9SS type A sorting domain-containing protein [Candidatus Marinimicrobia bacterium]|nr:T9SS type A sorting domain-containing protein [Candidatus Neomarinimicrobiota bacterium]
MKKIILNHLIIYSIVFGQVVTDEYSYSITLDKAEYSLGDTMIANLKMINLSNDTINFVYFGWYDWLLIDSSGTDVDGISFIPIDNYYTINPGDSLAEIWVSVLRTWTWDQQISGAYHSLMKPFYNYESNDWDTASFKYVENLEIDNLPDDSASFGILICDYQTGEFEEGTVLNIPMCTECDFSSFPFDVIFLEPGDFGSIQFNYSSTGDTVFFATIVWMGQGEIIYPDTFFHADSFSVEFDYAPDPDTLEYSYLNEISLDNGQLPETADSAYQHIRTLSLVHEFAEYPYQIYVYLYTPAVGATDLSVAKWIFFLFRNPELIGVQEDENPIPNNFKLYPAYPNPFNPTTTIWFSVETNSHASLQIFDITGRLVETLINKPLTRGEHEIIWNAGHFPSGVYFVRLQSGEFVENQKVILIK